MEEKKRHILVVSQYFYPEQFRINDICTEWVKRGYEVTVVTGIPNYPQGKFYEGYDWKHKTKEAWNGVNIIRIPLIARGHNAIGLIANYLSFVVSGFFWKMTTKVKADCVFNYEVSPMTQVLVGAWYAKKQKVPCYLYLTDLWPDNVEIVTGIHNKFVIGLINKMVNYVYKHCDKIFTSSKSFIDKLIERSVERNKLIFWPQYAEPFYKPVELTKSQMKTSDANVFKMVFAGNIGYAQGLKVLVDAAVRLKKENLKVQFNIIGDGRYKSELVKEVKENGIEDYFEFFEKQPAERIPVFISQNDVSLICLDKSDVFAMTIPAKTQSCMACAKPILVAADGEIQQIIKEAKCGYASGSLDGVTLAGNIKRMLEHSKEEREEMGRNAREFFLCHFEREKLLDQMDVYLKG